MFTGKGADQLQITSRRAINAHNRAGTDAFRHIKARQFSLLRKFYVIDQRAGSRDLCPAKGTETIQRRNTEEPFQAFSAISRIKALCRQGRQAVGYRTE